MTQLSTVRVANDDIELLVVPGAGARIHSLRVAGNGLSRPPADLREHLDDPFYWGGFVMAPWCNRLVPGPVQFRDKTVDVPVNFKDGTAIHGQVYAAPWQQTGDGAFAI